MAWRPTQYLKEGELDNTVPGKVTGWIQFVGMKGKVTFELEGDFHRDIRGAKIHFTGEGSDDDPEAAQYMDGFSRNQKGKVGDITAGMPPYDYTEGMPYVEWYGEDNGRVVLELEPNQVDVIGNPLAFDQQEPLSRAEQGHNMASFLCEVARCLNAQPMESAGAGDAGTTKPRRRRAKRADARGMKLLTEEIRRKLPPLGSQDGKGGKAIAHVRFFTPDNSWVWHATEYDGKDTFFGLVEGFEKELGYFSLSELESVRGPLGLAIERDLYWEPRTLEEIAPEMFTPVLPARH